MKAREHYDAIAPGYSELYGEEQKAKLTIIRYHLNVRKGETLLDVGCGTGLSNRFFQSRIVGIDPSKEMMLQAKKREEGERGEYIQCVVEQLPFHDSVFDVVISVTAIHNFTDPEKGLKEMSRVCKARLAITILKKARKRGRLEELVESNFRVIKRVEDAKDIILFCEPKG